MIEIYCVLKHNGWLIYCCSKGVLMLDISSLILPEADGKCIFQSDKTLTDMIFLSRLVQLIP